MTWVAPLVTLYDGRQVPSDSREWQLECEARTVLAMTMAERAQFFEKVLKIRKHAAWEELRKRCFELEPHYVLSLPDKPARHAYCAQVEARFGPGARAVLEGKVRELWKARQAAAAAAAAGTQQVVAELSSASA